MWAIASAWIGGAAFVLSVWWIAHLLISNHKIVTVFACASALAGLRDGKFNAVVLPGFQKYRPGEIEILAPDVLLPMATFDVVARAVIYTKSSMLDLGFMETAGPAPDGSPLKAWFPDSSTDKEWREAGNKRTVIVW